MIRSAAPCIPQGAHAGTPARTRRAADPSRHGRCTALRHDRPPPRAVHRRVLRGLVGVRAFLRSPRRCPVNLEYGIGLALGVLLTVYLVYALLWPERF